MSPPLPAPAPAPSLSQRLTLVVQALRAAIAAHAARDRATVAVAWLVWPYLNRLAARFAALALRVQAGKPAVAPRATRPRAAPETPRSRSPGLPRGFAWLARFAPGILPLRGQVCHLLGDPELAALLAAAPQAGRILRPLCRMLGIEAGPGFPPALFQRPDPSPPPDPPSTPPPGPSPVPPPSPALAQPAPQARAAAPPAPEPPMPSRPPPRRRARPRVPAFGAALA